MSKRPTNRRPNARAAFLRILRGELWGNLKSSLQSKFSWLQSLVVRPGRVRVPRKATNEPKFKGSQRSLVTPEGLEVRKLLAGDVFVATASNLDEDDFFSGGFVIAATAAPTTDLEVSYTIGGTASAADYNPLSGVATITAGDSFTVVNVTPVNDDVLEPTEILNITLTGTNDEPDYTLSAVNPVSDSLAIFDDDDGTLGIAAVDAVASELAGDDGEFMLTIDGGGILLTSATDTTVSLSIGGSATNGSDYATIDTTVVIPAGAESYSIPVDVLSDTINFDDGEEVIISVTGVGTSHPSLTHDATPATVTIDDPSRAIASISSSATTVAEDGTGEIEYIVSLDQTLAPGGDVTVAIDLTGDAGAADYTPASPLLVTLAPGDITAAVTLSVDSDDVIEDDESVLAELTYVGGSVAIDGSANTAAATIIDNDDATLSVSAGSVDESAGTADLTFSLGSKVVGQDTTFTFGVTGDAEATDYTIGAGTNEVVILSGNSQAIVTVAINDDSVVEDDEEVIVSLSGQTNGPAVTLSGDPATLTIEDNDIASYTITGASVAESSDVVFSVALSNEVEQEAVLSYALANGTAVSPGDFDGTAGLVTVAAGESTAAITVSVTDDNIVEPSETFDIALTGVDSAAGSVVAGSPAAATATIVDNDALTVNVIAPVATVTEPSGSVSEEATFLVVLSNPVADSITVGYTHSGSASDPDDYTTTTTPLTFAAGQQVATVTVDIQPDSLIETNEEIVANLAVITSPGYVPAAFGNDATITIEDDDSGSVSLSPSSQSVTEGDTVSFTFSQTGTATTNTVLAYTIVPGPADATGASTLDYTGTQGTVTIAALSTSAVVTIDTVDDMIVEPDQSFTVNFSKVSSDPSIAFAPETASVVIEDNDDLTVDLTSVVTDFVEGDSGTSTHSYEIALSSVSDADVEIVVQTVDGTATAADGDFNALNQTLTIAAGDTTAAFEFVSNGDTDVEPDETLAVSLTSVDGSGASVAVGAGSQAVTITNDDTATVSLSGPASVTEGTSTASTTDAVFTLSLNAPSSVDTVIAVSTADGTATAGDNDFAALSSELVTIAANSTSALVTVAITADAIDESVEDFGVNAVISDTNGASIVTATAMDVTVDIIDDDDAQVTVTAVAGSVSEGSAAEFEISLSPSSEDVTVFYETVDGSATSADYTATTASVVVPASSTGSAVTVAIATTADTLVETEEDFSLSITSIEGGASHSPMILTATDVVTLVDSNSATLDVSGPSNIDEDMGPANFTIALGARTQDTVISYTTAPGTAVEVDDFTATSGQITIAPNASATDVVIPVTITDDALLEDSEDFGFSISLIDDNGVSIAVGTDDVSVTIDDDDTATVSASQLLNALETTGGTIGITGRYIVSIDQPSETDTTVSYTIAGTAATTDYLPIASSVVIPANETTINVDVVPTNDLEVEGDETVILTIVDVDGDPDIGYSTAPASLTIEDNDAALVNVTGASVTEASGTATFAISLTKPSATDVTVAYNLDGTAISPDDYTTTGTGLVTFIAGETAKTVELSIVDDAVVEGTELAGLSITSVTGNPLVSAGTASDNVTITDDDSATIQLIPAANPVSESGSAQFLVLLSSLAQEDTTVTIDLSGTALPTDDYTSPAGTVGTVVIPGGSSSGSLYVTLNDDDLVEEDETLIGSIGSVSGVGDLTTAAPTVATIVINDNDEALATVASDTSVNEDDGTAVVNVTLSNPSDAATVVSYSLSDGTAIAGGAASIGADDYAGTTGEITIGAGDTVGAISVTLVDDAVVEETEDFVVTLTGASGNTSVGVGSPGASTVSIHDDDSADITVGGVSVTEGTGAGTTEVTLTITQSSIASTDTEVDYSTTDGTADATDYTPTSGTATISAGTSEATVVIPINRDTLIEANEIFTLDLDSVVASGDADITIGAADEGSVTIYDDDSSTLRIPAVATAVEESGEIVLTLSLTNPSGTDLTVDYTVGTTGTSTSDAEADDFDPSGLPSGQVTIGAGDTLADLTIALLDDNIVELDETFTVSLSNLQGGGSISIDTGADTATVNIENNDVTALRILTADGPATSVNESVGDSGLFFLSLSAESSTDTTVTYSVGGDASVTEDYDAIPTTAVIPAGSQSLAISVNVIDDTVIENDEVISVSLESTSNADILVNLSLNDVADATILNDDGIATLTSDTSPLTITEGADAVFVLSLSGATDTDTVVTYDLVGSSRFYSPDNMSANTLIGNDTTSTLGTGTATILAGETSIAVTVDTIDDSLVESDEEISIESVVGTGVTALVNGADDLTVVVEDNDSASLVLVADENGFEGGPDGRFRLVLTNPVDVDTVVALLPGPFGPMPPTAADGGGVDFDSLPTEVTIGAGSNSEAIDVTITDDTIAEVTEHVFYKADSIVSSDPEVSLIVGSDQATVSIFDNDGITVTVSDTTVAEDGGPATVIIALSEASPADTTVSFSLNDGSAVSAEDYSGSTGTVLIPMGATTAAISVSITDDDIVEDDEVFSLSLTGVAANGVATAYTSGESADITIDSEDTATVEVVDSSTTEGDEIVVQVSMSNLSDAPTTVTLGASSGTADGTLDYSLAAGPITAVIPADTATASVTLATTEDDALFEGAETVLVSVTSVDSAYGSTITPGGVGTATILDNEDVTISVTSPTSTAVEGGADGVFLISLSAGSIDEDVTVFYDATGSAVDPDDYTVSGSVVVDQADMTAAVTIDAVDDTINELDETVILSPSSIGGVDDSFVTGLSDSATVTIADTDTPIVSAEFIDSSFDEGDSTTLVISLDKPATDDFTISYGVGGDASDPADYSGLSGSVSFTAGDTSVAVVVSTVDDSFVEADETINVTLGSIDSAASLAAVVEAPGTADATIVDNDDALLTVSKLSDAIDPESGPVTDGVFLINLSSPSLTDTTVSYSIGGSAVEGTEYDAIGRSVVIPAGMVDALVTITPDDGSLVEVDETVEISLTAFDGNPFIEIVSTSDDMAVLTIIDQDEADITVDLSEDTVSEGDDFILNITLSKGTEDGVVLDLAATGTSITPSDVSGLPATVSFAPGATTAAITITAADDAIAEGTETLAIDASNSGDYGGSIMTVAASTDDVVIESENTLQLVGSPVINGGDAQRSRVTEMTLVFNGEVDKTSELSKFEVINRGTLAAIDLSTSTFMYNAMTGQTTVTLLFSGAGTESGSLADGNYELNIAGAVEDNHGNVFDGDGNGTTGDGYTFGDSAADGLYRLYGDINGDRTVNVTDYLAFLAVFGSTSDAFDIDASGSIAVTDYLAFLARFGSSLTFA